MTTACQTHQVIGVAANSPRYYPAYAAFAFLSILAAATVTADAVTTNDSKDRTQLVLVAGCFLLSGFAALLYETVWLRQFSINFGTSEQALAIVLGTYMGGLALGSLIASRFAGRLRRPLLTYGLLELGIAVTALLVPVSLHLVRQLQVLFFGGVAEPPAAGEPSQILFSFVGAFAATILPTTMMGATLPMLAKHVVHRDDHLGKRIGALYAINTLGAVFGTLSAAFICLPNLGLQRTIFVGATINLFVFAIVWLMLRNAPAEEPVEEPPAEEESSPASEAETPSKKSGTKKNKRLRADRRKSDKRRGALRAQDEKTRPTATPDKTAEQSRDWILWLILCSGAVSFAYEILFTRMLGHFLGGSVFAFSSMLASFLLGIAIGGAIASRLARRPEPSAVGFFYAQCGTMLLALVSWYSLEALAGWINGLAGNDASGSVPRVLCVMAILFPPAVTIGMTFPFAIRIHARDERDAAKSSAKVYAWNTVGGVTGALVTGTYLLPLTNYQLAMAFALVANLTIALFIFLMSKSRSVHLVMAVVAVAAIAIGFPKQPDQLLRVSSFEDFVLAGELVYVRTGRSATVTTHNNAGDFAFSTNGLPEAGASPKGSFEKWDAAPAWLGLLPTLIRPDAETLLVIGFGGGVAPAHAPQSIREIDVFELEEGIIEANQLVASERARDPLSDSRINVILNDGRGGLALTNKTYDAVVSQPSHPWTAGASHLYTREFAELVRDHLTDDGIFVLWMDAQFIDVDVFRSLGATLGEVYPYTSLYRPNYSTLLFVGSAAPLDTTAAPVIASNKSDEEYFEKMGVDAAGTLLAVRALDDAALRELCKGASATTDNNNLLALRRVKHDKDGTSALAVNELINEFDPLHQTGIPDEVWTHGVDRLVIQGRRQAMGRIESVRLIAEQVPDESRRWLARGFTLRSSSKLPEAVEAYQKSVEADPTNEQAWVYLYLMSQAGLITGDAAVDAATAKEHLTAPYTAIVDATESKKSQQTGNMKEVDKILASIPKTDPFYGPATMLRIQWRDWDDKAGTTLQRGRENLKLIDQVAPYAKRDELLMYRLKAAAFAGRPFIGLTTAQMVANSVRDKNKEREAAGPGAAGVDVNAQRVQLANCLTAIKSFEGDRRVPAHRYYGVRLYIETQLQEISAGP